MSVEHEHEDGTKHAHKGGDKPHTHEKKSKKCSEASASKIGPESVSISKST